MLPNDRGAVMEDFLEVGVEDLGLSGEVLGILRHEGVGTVGDLFSWSGGALRELVGRDGFEEIIFVLLREGSAGRFNKEDG